ncbi:putative zinc finger protein 4-like [Capsicum annuum]|nr:putative zinc finger protein 4-like [Capsicum annuum]
MAMLVPKVTLNSGHEMPLIGMGTAPTTPPLPPIDQLVSIFIDAIEAGYQNFDTVTAYGTEEALGRAVSSAKARTDEKKSSSVRLYWKLNMRPRGAQLNFIDSLGHVLGYS